MYPDPNVTRSIYKNKVPRGKLFFLSGTNRCHVVVRGHTTEKGVRLHSFSHFLMVDISDEISNIKFIEDFAKIVAFMHRS